MSDRTPPPDLIDKLLNRSWDGFRSSAHAEHQYDAWCAICRGDLPRILGVLTEWADGGLIDPTTWQRYDRTEVEVGTEWQGSGYLSYEVPIIEWPTEPWESKPVDQPLFVLTPREDNQ